MCEVQNGMHHVAPSEHALNVAEQLFSLQMERLGSEYVGHNVACCIKCMRVCPPRWTEQT